MLTVRASACVFSRTYTCSQLGMVANDYNARSQNTAKLIKAINEGYTIICDATYFLTRNQGDIKNSVIIKGNGTFIFDGNLDITHNIREILLNGVSFVSYDIYSGKAFDAESPKCVFCFPKTEQHYSMAQIIVKNCHINNISLIRFPNRTGDYIRKVEIENNEWRNMSYLGVGIISTNIDKLLISNNKAFKVKSRLFDFATGTKDLVKDATITNNYLSNKGYFSTTTEFYAGFAVVECINCTCTGNIMENFVLANENVNLYDIYCNCSNLVYSNNKKYNVINFNDTNLLCKAKAFIGAGGSRIVKDNVYIVEDAIIERYRSQLNDKCSIRMISLSPDENNQQSSLKVKNNYIRASVPCSFGMSSGTNIKDVRIEKNTIECQTVSEGDYYYRGISDDVNITGNIIKAKERITTNTPAVSLHKGRYKMEKCTVSAFPGTISAEVETDVSNCVFSYSYRSQSSPHIAIGGTMTNCMIDFQNFDLSNSYNVYIAKAKNPLHIRNLTLKNVPMKGTLWFRYLLDANHSAEFIEMELILDSRSTIILINNVEHYLIVSGKRFSIVSSKQDANMDVGKSNIKAFFYSDRLGLSNIKNNMMISVRSISESYFRNQMK